ncbi:MAG: TetR family transcriptional regulator, partial [Actinobacteria bacterium]|nr:TetR family transcriptional regulator [Actinomycetota bacterium]
VEVIAAKGLCDTRISDIAERARTSAALVIYYFQTKDQLLTEALTFAEDRFYLQTFHELTDISSASDRLVRLIEISCPPEDRTHAVVGGWILWIEIWSRAVRDGETARKREALDRRWRSTIAGIVRDGQQSGEFADVDADDFSLQLASLIDGLALQVVLGDREVTPTRARDLVLDVARRELKLDEVAAT